MRQVALEESSSRPVRPLLCYVTGRRQFSGTSSEQQEQLLARITECAEAGVDYIQLREKDLSARELENLAQRAMAAIPKYCGARLLINSRIDVALAVGAAGVHLPAGSLAAGEARAIWGKSSDKQAVIGVSAHSVEEVAMAESHEADYVLFGPVFEKEGLAASGGLEKLTAACNRPETAPKRVAVLALGGITPENARQCFAAGAWGVAGIRLFQQGDCRTTVEQLRGAFVPDARGRG